MSGKFWIRGIRGLRCDNASKVREKVTVVKITKTELPDWGGNLSEIISLRRQRGRNMHLLCFTRRCVMTWEQIRWGNQRQVKALWMIRKVVR